MHGDMRNYSMLRSEVSRYRKLKTEENEAMHLILHKHSDTIGIWPAKDLPTASPSISRFSKHKVGQTAQLARTTAHIITPVISRAVAAGT